MIKKLENRHFPFLTTNLGEESSHIPIVPTAMEWEMIKNNLNVGYGIDHRLSPD